ncbi:hypothetical protein [Streptomyces yanii]|uniref:Uncharacterized protein n=1 Tax=Streptomyces yanii TaxID=78510 RepID=A0ABV5RJK4_9ACTN
MPRLQWPRIVDRAADIVTSYGEVGGCTLWQAYCRLVAEGLIPHIPWDAIRDDTQIAVEAPPSFAGPAARVLTDERG